MAKGVVASRHRDAAAVLRCELLERTGAYSTAFDLAQTLLRSRTLCAEYRSTCEFVIGRLLTELGDLAPAKAHLQRSATIASESHLYERLAWAQQRLLLILLDETGFEVAAPLLSELRLNASRSGNPHLFAIVHLNVAEMESKRGALMSAEHHIQRAESILADTPNVWLQAVTAQNRAALSCLRLDFEHGLAFARQAKLLSEDSGWAVGYTVSLANLGRLLYLTGQFEEAYNLCEQARLRFSPHGDNYSGNLETLAAIRLAQGSFEESESLLQQIAARGETCEGLRDRFVYRHSLLTYAQLLRRNGREREAGLALDEVRERGVRTRDGSLLARVQLERLHLMSGADPAAMTSALEALSETLVAQPPDFHAEYEGAVGKALPPGVERDGHVARATTIFESLGHRLGLQLMRSSVETAVPDAGVPATAEPSDPRAPAPTLIQGLASLVNHAGRPRLIACELLDILRLARCVQAASVVSCKADGTQDRIAAFGDDDAPDTKVREIVVGRDSDRTIVLKAWIRIDVEAAATLNAVAAVVHGLTELAQFRVDKAERERIWPVDAVNINGLAGSVISGHLRDVMNFAQRVARTSVSVLITGESGTGKEIIARAIHDYSARAAGPFVPFNCAALPKELVESQLFGHRRGAFTGAERDYTGVIRSANGGTLLLDEVGELIPELQPKLLRFLESGEISPLGEPSPLNVDVRIVAATNANLEEGVRSGRFREDLFYRLNVVRLSLRPLRERRDEIPAFVNHFVARFAEAFHKGHLEVADETLERLLLYRWPGNVRQLQNEISRIVALAEPNSTLLPSLLSESVVNAAPVWKISGDNGTDLAISLHDKLLPTLERVECEMIKTAIHNSRGKMDAAAKALGISRKGLYLKRQRFGL